MTSRPTTERKPWPRAASLAALLTCLTLPVQAETWTFAVLGDTPYTQAERNLLPGMLDALSARNPRFALHVGDIKSGSSPCDDEVFKDRLQLFLSAPIPLVYVLGDNEWTDCHRAGADPLERLQRLRQMFHPAPRSLGKNPIPLQRQTPDYPENMRWRQGGVLFIGLNLPGSDNNHGPGSTPSPEMVLRDRANALWMAEGFRMAREEKRAAVIVAVQANPNVEAFIQGRPTRGYGDFLTRLREETRRFPGQVVLLHGDTHTYRNDQPWGQDGAHRPLMRIETYGYPRMGWVEGIVEESTGQFSIRFEPRPWSTAPAGGAE